MPREIAPTSLDHVAFWVDERQAMAGFCCEYLGMHVIEETDSFTLIGVDAKLGKLTLFDAEGPRTRGALERVALRVGDVGAAVAGLPQTAALRRCEDGSALLEAPGGLPLKLLRRGGTDFDLDHVVLRLPDREAALEELVRLGFERRENGSLCVADRELRVAEGAGRGRRPPAPQPHRAASRLRGGAARRGGARVRGGRREGRAEHPRRIPARPGGRAHRVRRAQARLRARLTVSDIVIAGAGMAGLAPRREARRLGADALVLEKLEHAGGSMQLSSGVIWPPRARALPARVPAGDPELQRLLFERLDVDLRWLESLGAPVTRPRDRQPAQAAAVRPRGTDRALVAAAEPLRLATAAPRAARRRPLVLSLGGFGAPRAAA